MGTCRTWIALRPTPSTIDAKIRWCGLTRAAAAILSVAALVGCAMQSTAEPQPAKPPPKAGPEKVSVLYRVDLRIDGKQVSPWARRQAIPFRNNVRIYVANFDRHEPVRLISHPEPISGALGEGGWATLALEPGSYFFLVLPPGTSQARPAVAFHAATARFGRLLNTAEPGHGGVWDATAQIHVLRGAAPSDFEPIAGFLLRVPEKRRLVYAGTLRITCREERRHFDYLIGVCSDIGVSDETAAAQAAAGALDVGAANLQVSLLSRYGSPTAPLDVTGTVLEIVAVPPLKDESRIDFTPPAEGPPFVVGGSSPALNVLNLLSVLGHSSAVAASQMEAQAQAEKWRPCAERLARETRSIDFMALVSRASASALAPLRARTSSGTAVPRASASGEPRVDYILSITASPRQLRLRQCVSRTTFCLELAMRIEITDMALRREIFDAELVYTNAWPPSNMQETSYRLYQIPAGAPSECRTLESWCGGAGAEMLRQEVATAIRAIVRTAVQRAAAR